MKKKINHNARSYVVYCSFLAAQEISYGVFLNIFIYLLSGINKEDNSDTKAPHAI